MRKVTGIAGTASARLRPESAPSCGNDKENSAEECRALVAIDPAASDGHPPLPPGRTFVPFIAQLIATERQAPQTRLRRRAAPEETIAAYTGGLDLPRTPIPHRMRQSV